LVVGMRAAVGDRGWREESEPKGGGDGCQWSWWYGNKFNLNEINKFSIDHVIC
jgi:hypothetical protein